MAGLFLFRFPFLEWTRWQRAFWDAYDGFHGVLETLECFWPFNDVLSILHVLPRLNPADCMLKAVNALIDLSKSGFRSISDSDQEALATIGKFILSAGAIDATLSSLLQALINIGDDPSFTAARAVTGGMRASDIMGAIRRIIKATPSAVAATSSVESLFSEIETLRRERDVVAHRQCLINGDKLAFHNALFAKDDNAVDVQTYSIAELKEFDQYAEKLTYRVLVLHDPLMQKIPKMELQAIMKIGMSTALMHALTEVVKTRTMSRQELSESKRLLSAARESVKGYQKATETNGGRLEELHDSANRATIQLAIFLAGFARPDKSSLLEIPARLRNKNRSQNKDTSRSRGRPRPSSPD